jgi:dephospho-CoA kinase
MTGNQIRVAISGKARSGKNLIAELLIEHLKLSQNEYRIRAFADPMKEIVKIMFPCADDECLYGASQLRSEIIDMIYHDEDARYLTYRKVLTDLGKQARKYNKNIWIHNFDYDLKKNAHARAYVCSDARFLNEIEYLKDRGFYLIRVLRNGTDIGKDVSETEQDTIPDSVFNKVIHNDYSIDQLSEEVKQIVDELRIK